MNETIANLAVKLAMDSSAFATGSTDAQRTLGSLRDSVVALGDKWNETARSLSRRISLPVTGAFATFGAAARGLADDLEGVRNSANLAGEGFVDFQRQAYAARTVGIEYEKLGDIFKDTQDKVGDFLASGGGEMADFFENIGPKVGVTAEHFRGLGGKDALQLYYSSLREANVSSSEMVFYMEAIADEASGLVPLLEENGRLFDEIGGNAPVVDEAAAASFDRYRDSLKRFGDAIDKLTVAVANSGVLDMITGLVERAAGFVEGLANANPWLFRIAAGFALMAASIGPIMLAMGTLAATILPLFAAKFGPVGLAISAFINPLGTAISFLAQFATQLAGMTILKTIGATLLRFAGPVGLIASAGLLIYQNWERIAPMLQEFWDKAKQALGGPLQKLITTISDAFDEFWSGPMGDGIRKAMELLAEFGQIAMEWLGDRLINVLGAILEVALGVFRQIGLAIEFVNAILNGDWAGAWEAAKAFAWNGVNTILEALDKLTGGGVTYIRNLVNGIRTWVVDRLDAIWDTVTGKIDAVKTAFFDMYDAVVGNSYVPDMVEEIGQHMNRLDALMVAPARAATAAVSQAMREMASETQMLLDRLFPEVRRLLDYRKDLATIENSGLSAEQQREARYRLGVEVGGGANDNAINVVPFDTDAIVASSEDVSRAVEGIAGRTEDATVEIARSFKDMTDEALGSLRTLLDGIKGGGFLDILEGVLGVGLQIAGLVTGNSQFSGSIPRFATGTNFAPGGLSLVGERGPELVNLPRGSQVIPNHELRGLGGSLQVEVVANNNGFGAIVRNHAGQVVAEAAPSMMQGASQVTQRQMGRRQTRRVA